MTLEELLALWNEEATRAEMTREQLAELRSALEERARELLDGERTDEVLVELDQIAVTCEAIDERDAALVEAEREGEERAADLASRIFGQEGEGDGEGEGSEGEGDGASTEGEGEGTSTEEGDGAASTEGEEGDGGAEGSEGEESIAAAAAATDPRYTPRISGVNARRPASSRPRTSTARTPATLVASANMGGVIQAGQPIESPEDLSAAFLAAWENSAGYRGPRMKISVARSGGDPLAMYGEERFLDQNPRTNHSKLEALVSPQAIIAAGGRCIQSPVNYDQPNIVGTDARPVRDDMLVRVGADRGGVVTYPPAVLTDLTGAVSDWSLDNDEVPGSDGPTTKPCLTMTCPEPDEDVVGAVIKCIKIGNFRSRFFAEQVQEWLELAAVWQARHAERRLLAAIAASSTHVSIGQTLGTSRDVLAGIDRVSAAFRSRHRTPADVPLHFGAPDWLGDQIRVDIARQMPVGTLDETLALAEAQIERWLTIRNLNVTWTLDGESGQEFGPQGDGPALGWPDKVVTYLYPEGVHQFLDGGMFDFGIMRDTETTKTNDFQVFAETLEGHHFHGVESFRIEFDVCPDGSASALVDIAPCSVGS